MAQVCDPVFAQEIVGPGLAVLPQGDGPQDVVAPIDGRLVKVHPHAFVVLGANGVGVLVHLGLDTVKLGGEGFTVHRQEKETVAAGDPIITWDPASIATGGLDPIVPVVIMETGGRTISKVVEPGAHIEAGTDLIHLN